MRLSKQEAFTQFDKIYDASSLPELLEIFDAVGATFGVQGFALFDWHAGANDRPEEIATRGGVHHFTSESLLAAIPHTHCLVIAPDGPAWERLAALRTPDLSSIRRTDVPRMHAGGILVPVQSTGDASGVSFLGREQDEDAGNRVWLMILAEGLDATWRKLGKVKSAASQRLSPRELEILRWLAEGKSAEDVATIVALAPATVMFHYRNVAQRFGTLNRTHTIVEAIRRGLLNISESDVSASADDERYDSYSI